MTRKKTDAVPDTPAKLLFSTSVSTDFGPRDIRFYWGDLASLVRLDSVVVISTSCFQPQITGMAWRSLTKKYQSLSDMEKDFREVIVSSPLSSLWHMSDEALQEANKYKNDCDFKTPAILVSPKTEEGFERIFVARTLSAKGLDDEEKQRTEYKRMVNTCFPV